MAAPSAWPAGGISVGANGGVGTILVSGSGAELAIAAGATGGINVANGLIEVAGGGITNLGVGTGMTLFAAGTLAGDGVVTSSISDFGTIIALGGSINAVAKLELADSVNGAGGMSVANYNVLQLDQGLSASGGTITLGTASALVVGGRSPGATPSPSRAAARARRLSWSSRAGRFPTRCRIFPTAISSSSRISPP